MCILPIFQKTFLKKIKQKKEVMGKISQNLNNGLLQVSLTYSLSLSHLSSLILNPLLPSLPFSLCLPVPTYLHFLIFLNAYVLHKFF